MSLHISLSDLHGDGDFSTSFYTRYFSSFRSSNQLRCIQVDRSARFRFAVCTFVEASKELKERVRSEWRKHPDCLLMHAGLDGHMNAAVGLDMIVTLRVLRGAVHNELWPPERGHRTIGHFEGEIPDDLLQLAALPLETVLPDTRHPQAAVDHSPVLPRHKVVMGLQAVELSRKFSVLDLTHHGDVEVGVRLPARVKVGYVLVVFVVVFLLQSLA